MTKILIDHTGAILFPQYRILRTIGRLAFPVFCYQLAVGYDKTSDVDKYLLRVLKFGFLAQVPYWFLNHELQLKTPLVFNVMFLLGLGIVMLKEFNLFKTAWKEKSPSWILHLLLFLVIIALPDALSICIQGFGLSYGSYGLLLIFGFYLFKENMLKMTVFYILTTLFCTYTDAAKYACLREYSLGSRFSTYFSMLSRPGEILQTVSFYSKGFLTGYFFQARSIFSLFFIWLLNKTTSSIRLNRYVGYWFYPVHIAVLELIALFIQRVH